MMPIRDNFETQYINNVSEYENGLMSVSDKLKLDNIQLEDIEYIQNSLDEINEYMVPQFIYGIKIDTTNPDSDECVTYTDDAVGFIPLNVNPDTGECNYGSWKDIIDNILGIKPCLMKKDGTIITYLNPDNYNQTINGNTIDIESGDLGQVMIRFKHIYYKFSMDGDSIWFQISNKQTDSTWVDTAFAAEDGIGTVRKEMFISAYETVLKNNTLQSISNGTLLPGLNFNGADNSSSFGVFHMMNIVKKEFIIFLGYLVTKSINLLDNIGNGNSGYAYNDSNARLIVNTLIDTGTMNDKGLFYGNSYSYIEGVKLFGIENLWGNSFKCMQGLIQRMIYVLDKETMLSNPEQHVFFKESYPYNKMDDFDDGGIINITQGYINKIYFLSDSIYIPKVEQEIPAYDNAGSSSTYFKSIFENMESSGADDILYSLYGFGTSGPEGLVLCNESIIEYFIDNNIPLSTHLVY